MPRLLSHAEVDVWCTAQRRAVRTIGFTCGAFDLLHAGHVAYLETAASRCDRLLVAVNSDASIRRYKSPLRPLQPERSRLRLVAALRSVDAVTLLDADRPLALLERWRPDIYIKGGGYRPQDLRSAPAVEAYGGRVEVIAVQEPGSTTDLIQRIGELALYAAPSMRPSPARLVLLDRDGTLIEDVPYLRDPARVRLLPGVGEGLALLQKAGWALVIVTNQQGLGLGFTTYDEFVAVNRTLLRQLSPFGVSISKIYFCPHALGEACACRKPSPGLLERALRDYQASPQACYYIGNAESDMQAASRAGCRGYRVTPNTSFLDAVGHIRAAAVTV